MIYDVEAHVLTEQRFSVNATDVEEAKAFAAAYIFTSTDRYPMFDVEVRPTGKDVDWVDILRCEPASDQADRDLIMNTEEK